MTQAFAGETALPQNLVLPIVAGSGGSGVYLAIINLAGVDYACTAIALGALTVLAVCVVDWSIAKADRDSNERRYHLVTLAYQLCDAGPGTARAKVLAQVAALPSPTDRETVMLMADGQMQRATRVPFQASDDEIRSLTIQAQENTNQIRRYTIYVREVRQRLAALGEWLLAQSLGQATDEKAVSTRIVTHVVAELTSIAKLDWVA